MSNAFDPSTAKPVSVSNKSGNVFDPSTAKPVEEPASRSVLAAVNDTVIEVGNAAAGGVSSAANFIKPGNAVSGYIDKNIVKAGEEKQSDAVKAEKKRYADEMAAANGIGDEVGATLGYVSRNPVLAAAQAAGSFVGPGAAIKGFGTAAKAVGAGSKTVTNAGRAGGVVASGAMAGGDAAGTAHELAKNAGATDEQAVEAGRQASMIPGAIGAVTGAFGAEKLLAGAKGFGGSAAARAFKTGASEALQEGIEEGVTQYEGQRAAMPYDSSIDPSKGVAGAATLGAVLGGATGAGMSLLGGEQTAQSQAVTPAQTAGAEAFASGLPRTPPESIKSVVAKAQWVRGWNIAQTQAQEAAAGLAPAAEPSGMPTDQPGAANEVGQESTLYADDKGNVGATPEAVAQEVGQVAASADIDSATSPGAAPGAEDLSAATESVSPVIPEAPAPELTPSQSMGLDPNAGALSKIAAMAVDSGASAAVVPQSPAQEPATDVQPTQDLPPGIDASTGEVSPSAPGDQINQLQAQADVADGMAQDWGQREYRPNTTELPQYAAQGGPADIQEANEQRRLKNMAQAKQEAGTARARAEQLQEQGNTAAQLAGKRDLAALRRMKTADMSTDELQTLVQALGPRNVRTKKLEKEIENRAAQAQEAAISGANSDGTQTPQTQQGGTQPAQAGAAQASAPAAPAKNVSAAESIAQDGNAQREQQRQRMVEASERWTRMPVVERQALASGAKGLTVIAKKNVHTRAWADLSEKVRGQLVDAMPSKDSPMADAKPFAAETGTLGIPRAEMPQVPTASHGGLVKHLNAQGIAHETTTADAAELKPTQAEYSPSKVKAAKSATGDRAVIVSNDGHIIDGHHQAVAAAEQGKQVKVIVLDAPVEQALAAVKASPSANASAAPAPVSPQRDGEEAVFSTTATKPAQSMAVYEVQAVAQRVLEDLGVGAKVRLQTFGKASESGLRIPPAVVPMGATSNGKVYLFAESLGDPLEVFRVVVHEVFNLGLSKSVQQGAYIQKMLGFLTDPMVRKYAERWKGTADGVSRKASMPVNNWQALAVEESLSDLAEELVAERDGIGSKPMTDWARRMASRLARWADGLGLKGVGQRIRAMTQTEVEQFIVQTLARADSDAPALLRGGRFSSATADQQVANESAKLEQESKSVPNFRRQEVEQIIDGHHQAVAAAEEGKQVEAIGAKEREGELPFSRSTREAPQTDQEKALVLQGAPVAEVDTAIAPMGAPAIRSWATDLFEQQGGKAHNPALGDVMLDGRSVRSSLAHGRPNAHKIAAFAAVKDVLEKGAVVLSARHGRDGDSFYVSAPVKVGGAINIVTVLVKRDPNDQRMYLHSVATKEYLLNRRVSRTDTTSGVERSGSNDSGDGSTLAKQRDVGKASTEEVANELHRLLTLNAGEVADNATTARFRREAADSATGADFDVTSFLQIMNEGQSTPPASTAAAGSAAQRVRPSYSPAARAEAVRAVTGTADAIRKAWANEPEVIVAFDMQDPVVPESARRADLKQRSGGARGAPEGFYYQGKVYLMASKLKTPNDAARVLFHEALGHHGLRGLFGKDLGLILNQVATMRKAEVDAKIEEYGLRRVNRLDRRTAAEEVLAEMAQNTPRIGFVRRAVAAIRTWLRTHVPGFKSLALTDAELIRNYILPARAWVESGGSGGDLSGVASFSRGSRAEPQTDMEKALLLQGAPVAVLDLKNAPSGGYAAVEQWAADLFAQQGGRAVSPEFGEVVLDARSAKSSVAHGGANDAKKVAFAAVKDVIERGALVYRTTAGNTDSFYTSAPVTISGKDNIVTVLVRRDHNTQRMYLHSVSLKENLLKPRVSSVDAKKASERSGSTTSGDAPTLANGVHQGKAATEDVARELNRLLTLDTNSQQGDAGEPMFSRSRFMDLKDSALDQLSQTFTHAGKVSLWDKSVGTMRHLAERAPTFKPVYESAQQNIDDVSMLANDAADMAPRILPRVESLRDIFGKARRKPVSAADNKAIAKPLFEGTLIWMRDETTGQVVKADELKSLIEGRNAARKARNAKALEDFGFDETQWSVARQKQELVKRGLLTEKTLKMWEGQREGWQVAAIEGKFKREVIGLDMSKDVSTSGLRPGIVFTDSELRKIFSLNDHQISLYREARAAIDRSIDMTARTDMLRVLGEEYAAMRDVVLEQKTLDDAATLLTQTLQQDARANPDAEERIGVLMQSVLNRKAKAEQLINEGYAPLSRFGNYKVYVQDPKTGESLYFGLYETQKASNLAKLQLAQEFKGATITQGTLSEQEHKLFAGVTPETLEQFGEMLGLKSEGNEAQDKAFQEFLKLTKNNHSAMKRLIHRKGIAGFSEDVGRVVANFVYSNARAGAMGLNAGKMETAIGKIPQEQGELKDLAMGLRDYIRDPQEEGQAVRGMLFAQYLGGSIASAAVNMTQPFQITMPWLSQYGGMGQAARQMARALKDMGRSFADKGFQYESDLAKALQAAEDDGTVSPQEIHALMAQARGAGMLRSGDGTKAGDLRAQLGNKWEQGKVLWGQPFALAEQFNRRSTFIASYRIAKEQGMADPAGFARKAVLETQFVYSKANKPKWARGAVGGTLFTFKTYSVSYLELMQRMWTQGEPEGKRAVGWALAMLVLMSGAGGLPFMEDAEDLIDGVGQMMGYSISSKQWRKEFLSSVVGKELGEFMEQGISGLPGAPVDVSGRLGLQNLIPGTGLALEKKDRMRDLLEIAGPAGDLVARGLGGARDVLKGALTGDAATAARGVMEWAPTAARNAAKGIDMAASGMYKDTKGYKVIDTTLAEAVSKFAGFQPKSVAEVQEANSFMQRSKSFYTQTSSEIKAQWADALFRKDEAAVQRVRERLAAWNRDNPEQPMVVRMPDVWKKVREMGKDRSDRIADTAPKALRAQMREMARGAG